MHFRKGEKRWPGLSLPDSAPAIAPSKTMIILHSLAADVEQLCARSPDAASRDRIRPTHCIICGHAARSDDGTLKLVGHGMYMRQVRGLMETGWIEVWIQRFLCLLCSHTMSLLPDWLLPYRWYAATAIVEALYRHCILRETASSIGARFGRPEDATEWKSLRRWRKQLLISSTLWGWLGPRFGATTPASDRNEARNYIERLLAEGRHKGVLEKLSDTVRRTLRDWVHNRKTAWPLRRFPPGLVSKDFQVLSRCALPTEKDSGPGPP
jgi:hypothetical protein